MNLPMLIFFIMLSTCTSRSITIGSLLYWAAIQCSHFSSLLPYIYTLLPTAAPCPTPPLQGTVHSPPHLAAGSGCHTAVEQHRQQDEKGFYFVNDQPSLVFNNIHCCYTLYNVSLSRHSMSKLMLISNPFLLREAWVEINSRAVMR